MGLLVSCDSTPEASEHAAACDAGDVGITLAPGFCATVFADHLGHVRHMVVAPDGVLYANSWSGRYYHNDTPPKGGFLLALRDTRGTGHADVVQRFGDDQEHGSNGGTGIAWFDGAVYAEVNDRIVRYQRHPGEIAPSGAAEVIVSGLPLTGDHPMHPFVIGPDGMLYVDVGSATNACQEKNRMTRSEGIQPCEELQTRAGTWRYDAQKTGQEFSPAERFVTGLRNGEGFAFDAQGRLYATQHGRDQLSQNWPGLYTVEQGADLPAEEIVQLRQNVDYGWPECYYDQHQARLVLAPEYGGDGGKTVGICGQKQAPVAAFPGHWAPNDLLIVTNERFPAAYQGGAFVAFHGSWNRAPMRQAGYNVVFQPLADGARAGNYVVFADGFAGRHVEPSRAAFRPTGLAMGPDGALYIADDVHGRIWRVVVQGDPGRVRVASAPRPPGAIASSDIPLPPEGMHDDAGRSIPDLPLPSGVSRDQLALGDRIFHGEVDGGTCSGCHGSDAKGGPQGPSLARGTWVWGDGSLAAISNTIRTGIEKPRNYSEPMPPLGGAQLSDADLTAVAAYVWAVGHSGQN
jgi:glucose/arabinose dehydrogenase/mono/diheme cytochrome c family protein